MDPSEYLAVRMPGYADLTDQERESIQQFSLMWSAFENKVCNTRATPAALLKIASSLYDAGQLDLVAFTPALDYFRARYCEGDHLTHHFHGLHLEEGSKENAALVEAVVRGVGEDPIQLLGGMLLIVHRYRNNLFHGVKWQYGIAGQHENFTHACRIMMAVMDRVPPAN